MTLAVPTCPGCQDEPAMVAGDIAVCCNQRCGVMTWDHTDISPESAAARRLLFATGLVERPPNPDEGDGYYWKPIVNGPSL